MTIAGVSLGRNSQAKTLAKNSIVSFVTLFVP